MEREGQEQRARILVAALAQIGGEIGRRRRGGGGNERQIGCIGARGCCGPQRGMAALRLPPDGKIAARRRPRNFTRRAHRSEEHTSELQSLMRISYAVFCLKKKKKTHKK